MIPKIIHYCWYGNGEMGELSKRCLASWKKHCPNYQFIQWNESNTDLNTNNYVKNAYNNKKWAFVSDYVRLKVLYEYGGIYLDTDVELLKNIDFLLKEKSFSGFETNGGAITGILASEQGLDIFKTLLSYYDEKTFIDDKGNCDITTNVTSITKTLLKKGLIMNNRKQIIEGLTIFPSDFFCPKDYNTGVTKITSNTVAIHHYNGSWLSDKDRKEAKIRKKLAKVLPVNLAYYIASVIVRIIDTKIEK